jgi:hypothetical protein
MYVVLEHFFTEDSWAEMTLQENSLNVSHKVTRQATAGLWTRPYQQQDLNLSLYSSLFSPDTIITALCCTFSRQALSPSVHGGQACVENSK